MAETFRCGHPRTAENSVRNGKRAGMICGTCKRQRGRSSYAPRVPGHHGQERAAPGQRVCDEPGCDGLHMARGKCGRHYGAAVRRGDIPSVRQEPCSQPNCCQPVRARGLCRSHYGKLMRGGALRLLQVNAGLQCSEPTCIEPARTRGMCQQHYNYWRTVERYGITREQYEVLVSSQGARCAVCGADAPGGDYGRWSIDHDHECCAGTTSCGRCVRGLLCRNCNLGLGHFSDDPDRLLAAAAYLLSRANLLEGLGSERGRELP